MHEAQLKIELSKVELKWIREYVRFLDDSVERELRNIRVVADSTDDERYIEKLIEDHHMVGFHFSKHTMYTAYTLVHSHFERALSEVVATITDDRPTLIKPSDLKGEDSIDKNKNYLKKVISLDLSSAQWSRIRPYIEARYLLVHSLGKLHGEIPSGRRQAVEQLVSSNVNLTLDKGNVDFTKQFVEDYTYQLSRYFLMS